MKITIKMKKLTSLLTVTCLTLTCFAGVASATSEENLPIESENEPIAVMTVEMDEPNTVNNEEDNLPDNTNQDETSGENTDDTTGDDTTGDDTTGDDTTGDDNTGDDNTGDDNTGDDATQISKVTIKEVCDAIIPATIRDSKNPETNVFSSYTVKVEKQSNNVVIVTPMVTGLKKHYNAEGTEGSWTGFAVIAPEGATQMKYAFGTDDSIKIGELINVETNINENDDAGIAFYTNIDANTKNLKTHAKLQWFASNGEALSDVITFEIELSQVQRYKRNKPALSAGGGGSSGGSSTSDQNKNEDQTTEPEDTANDNTENVSTLAFSDVDANAWFYEVIKTAVDNGLMNGISENEFAPNNSLTRGMFVTILYRLAGEPAVEAEGIFADVSVDQYYADAVAWASANGIVNGVSADKFAPNNNITREQMAAIIHRYATANNIEAVGNVGVTYSDSARISEFAKAAVEWASSAGILSGNSDGTFAPLRTATRAEAAAIFVRLLGLVK